VSCTSPTACVAVGFTANFPTRGQLNLTPVAERWNGLRWSIDPTPPGGAFSGVSCTSPTACVAVGFGFAPGENQVVFAERWNGLHWSVEPIPNPAPPCQSTCPVPPASGFSGVSCTSPTACVAVGGFNPSYGDGREFALVERWNRSQWSIQPTPNIVGRGVYLTGVSCMSARACTTVGNLENSTGTVIAFLAERWGGSQWVAQPMSIPVGTTEPYLGGVSCVGATACTAVGSAGIRPPAGFVERWTAGG
jgi:hypothetical protein